MSYTAEFQAAMPEPHVILGLRLRPLSLGRYRLLKRFDSPFVSDDVKELDLPTVTSELFFALVICGLPCREFADLETSGKLHRQLRRWGRRVRKYIKREKYFSILEKAEAFKRYLAEGSNVPWVIMEKQGNGEVSPTHWSHTIEVMLRSKAGWTLAEIEEEPLTKALADFFKYMESEGAVKLVDPDVYQQLKAEAAQNGAVFDAILK